jgi:hypothetical protein
MKKTATLYLCRGIATSHEYIQHCETSGTITLGVAKDVEINFEPVKQDESKNEKREHLNKVIEDARKELEKL